MVRPREEMAKEVCETRLSHWLLRRFLEAMFSRQVSYHYVGLFRGSIRYIHTQVYEYAERPWILTGNNLNRIRDRRSSVTSIKHV